MAEQKPFEFKSWMLIAALVAILCIVFNFDPVGQGLVNAFGKGADRWAINIILVSIIIYAFAKKK